MADQPDLGARRATRSPVRPPRRILWRVAALLGVVAATTLTVSMGDGADDVAVAAGDVGYPGPTFVNNIGSPSGEKPESKLWWNDGIWWGSLWADDARENHIFRLDLEQRRWVDTDIVLDPRRGSKADVLWDGTKLYVASHVFSETEAAGYPARLYRYSYHPSTQAYTLDAGFPATINDWRTETLVIDKDSTGQLWATWTQPDSSCGCSRVMYNRTVGDDASWGVPAVLPISGVPPTAGTLSGDDISALVSYGDGKIGLMWSNQNDSAMYFATHDDRDPDGTWLASRTAIQGPSEADDHINLKSLHSGGDGRVFAAVKSSQSASSAPLIRLLVRDPGTGDWTSHVFGRVSDHHTRPIVMLDTTAGRIHMLATADENGGTIYRKSSSWDSISFDAGRGEPFIEEGATPGLTGDLNNATSTKQNVNSTTGLVVLATNDTTDTYWWNYDPLGGTPTTDTVPPTVVASTPAAGAGGVDVRTNVTATFSEPVSGVSGSSMVLHDPSGAAVPASVSYDATTRTATLDPGADLASSTTYQVNLPSGITDLAGNGLAPTSWSFTTAATTTQGAIARAGTAVTATGGGATVVLPSWDPTAGELLVVQVARRKTAFVPSVSGNGVSWTLVADAKNVQNQGAVSVFVGRADPGTTAGPVTISLPGNASPVSAVAHRFSGVGEVGAVTANLGPATDDADLLGTVSAVDGAWVLAAGWHRNRTLTVPAGEQPIAVNVTSGTGGETTRASMWFEGPVTAGPVTVGSPGDLSGADDWALVLLELRPASAGPTTTTTVPATTTTVPATTTTTPATTTTVPATTTTVPATTTTVPATTTTTLPATTTTTLPPPPPSSPVHLVGSPVTVAGSGAAVSAPLSVGADELVVVQVARRDANRVAVIEGLGATWRSADVRNVQGQGGVTLFWTRSTAAATGTIDVRLTGNVKPLAMIVQRFGGTAGTGGVVTHPGPPVDNRDMLAVATDVDPGAVVIAAGFHRNRTFSVPPGESPIATNVVSGNGGDHTRASMWSEGSPTGAASLQLGAPGDLANASDWALVLIEILPAV